MSDTAPVCSSAATVRAEADRPASGTQLDGWQANLEWRAEEKQRGTIGYVGATYQSDNAFDLGGTRAGLLAVTESRLVDMIEINLNAGEPALAREVLPVAADLEIGVLVMRPFGEGALLRNAPAKEVLADWGSGDSPEALLRCVLTRQSVSVALTATDGPAHLRRNA